MEEMIDKKNMMVMKLLHYFITEQNYNPIILQGAENEIWLENLEGDYKIVRIVSNYIHNNEQFNFDIFKTRRVVKKIKKKTLSLKMNVLSIFTNLGDNVHLESESDIDCIFVCDEKDLKQYKFLEQYFPDIKNKLKFTEDGLQLFVKITEDINKKNKTDAQKVEEVFAPKKPVVTYVLIGINVFIYLLMILSNSYEQLINNFACFGPLIRQGEYYRLLTGAFLHGSIFHLLFNCYALYVIGSQLEGFMGKVKYLLIYLISAVVASLLSIATGDHYSVGASGAIFGLLGSLLYFGYHYRVYLGNVMKSQIVPLIIVNLIIGFMMQSAGIDNAAHIGGLLGGVSSTMALGVKYKSTIFEKVNGFIISIILIGFLIYLGFVLAVK